MASPFERPLPPLSCWFPFTRRMERTMPPFYRNYAYINLVDPLLRSPGVGNIPVFGAGQYAMRLWVKPDTLSKLGVTVPEIISAIQAQNTVNPVGKAGGEPAPKGQE